MFYSPFENVSKELGKIKNEITDDGLFFPDELTCKHCKTMLSDLLETGYVGCKDCYSVFGKDILDIIYNFHKSVKHTGKRPEFMASKAKKQRLIEELTKKQVEASMNEDYILAQSIKEKIALLKGEL